ncbi:hypothetical protein Clacol_004000 [Clathrus columnatus]|uniref:serine--tRNA ligase n=1 Tax=Clathrus columnatus TaxID=1419009 RepID=A0AAV5A9U9_9AGAM|nr:hypothetical protein Clacol_004000 [Clathrus columnatus]
MKLVSPTLLRLSARSLQDCIYCIRRHTHQHAHLDLSHSNLPSPRLDYRSISENILYKSHNAFNRKSLLPVGTVQNVARLYNDFKALSSELNRKLASRNRITEEVKKTKDATVKQDAIEKAKSLKTEISELKVRVVELEEQLLQTALLLPNDTHPDTPIGPEEAAVTLSTHGPSPLPESLSRDHVRIAKSLNLLDLDAGSTVTGTSWYYLINEGALLELALINYSISIAMKHGFKPVIPPDVVKADVALRCGFQPRDKGDMQQMYHIASDSRKEHPELVLSGTAEIPLAGLFANKVVEESQLPLKVVAVGKAFRAEAGARGSDTRGLYRVHQFTKVELFAVASESQSSEIMEDMKNVQAEIISGLNVPFRILDMPTEELGASAYRKYDIEAWMPGRGKWGEVTSTSNCTDYQSRRLHIRYRPSSVSRASATDNQSESLERQSLPFAHTLNGTAAAIPRLIIALLENGARLSGDEVAGLDLPSALKPFWIDKLDKNPLKLRWI